ncbi:inovirus-type Gp2 protein [Pseudomonas sp. MWU12-2323]|uniref:YagK/YfjJ domain-containing protein n=1 Tax=unclassified Pseudomonas TaxID=196821 RepID=UPI00128B79DD|nr:inovirus Gp2 family protein [Pseudomonas sp. MWU12-2323]
MKRLNETTKRALDAHSRFFAFRVHLHLQINVQLPACAYTNPVIDRFIESFKDKIRRNRRMALLRNPQSHGSSIRYVWAREMG